MDLTRRDALAALAGSGGGASALYCDGMRGATVGGELSAQDSTERETARRRTNADTAHSDPAGAIRDQRGPDR